MQNKVSFSNSSFSNLNKYIKPNEQNNASGSYVSKNNAPEPMKLDASFTTNMNSTMHDYLSNSDHKPFYKLMTNSDYSITSHSDKDNVNINQIRCIIRDSKNDLKKLQSDDCVEYNRLYLKNKLGFTDADAEKYSKEIYQLMLEYYGVDNIYDALKRDDFKNEVTTSNLMVRLSKAGEEQKLKDVMDTIGTTNLINMMNNYQNNTIDYLKLFNDFLTGRTLKGAMSYQEYTKYLRENIPNNKDDFGYAEYQYSKLHKYFRKNLNIEDYDLSDEMKKSVVQEIVDEDGYDAMVLLLPNGNYAIVNSCTNETESEDMGAIVGNIATLACADNFSKDVFGLYSRMLLGTDVSSNDAYSDVQITACEKLIKKYIDEGKNMELYGYSLGGGIMEAAYSRILEEGDSKYTDKIKSVCVYNPFTLIAELDEKANIDNLVGNEKFLRYCAEGDVVSTFNNYVEQLDGNTLYLKAAKINSNDWFEQRGKDCSPLELFTKGNHSFSAVNGAKHNSFDSNGNVTANSAGDFVSISNVINALNKDDENNYNDYKRELNSKNLNECMKYSFKDYANLLIEETGFESKLGDFAALKDPILNYCADNFGEIRYKYPPGVDYLTQLKKPPAGDIIGDYMSEYIWDKVEDTDVEVEITSSTSFKTGAKHFVDKEDFEDAVYYAFSHDTENIYKIIEAKYNKNDEAASEYVDAFVEKMMDDYRSYTKWLEFIDKKGMGRIEDNLKEQFKSSLKIKN